MGRSNEYTRLSRIHPKLCLGNLNTAKKLAGEDASFNFLCVNTDSEGCNYGYQIERLTRPVKETGKGKEFKNKCDIYIRDSTQNSPQDILDFTKRGAEAIHNFTTGEGTKDLDVLVHCYAGMNRSVSTIIRYAMDYRGWRFQDALDYIRRKNTKDREIRCDKTGSNWMFMRMLKMYDVACKDEARAIACYKSRYGCYSPR